MKMLDDIDKGKSPTIIGDGSEAFDFVAVEDCAKANICAIKSESSDSFYNVGTGIKTSLKELEEIILKLKNTKNKINYISGTENTFVKNRIGSPKKAFEQIKFKSSIDLNEGLIRLINWRNKHKNEI